MDGISVITLIRTDTTLDHSQKPEKVWKCRGVQPGGMRPMPRGEAGEVCCSEATAISDRLPREPVAVASVSGVTSNGWWLGRESRKNFHESHERGKPTAIFSKRRKIDTL